MPANRYAQVAPKVKALCAEYGIHYNEASFIKQFSTVWVRLAKCSLPNHWTAQIIEKTHSAKSALSYFKSKIMP